MTDNPVNQVDPSGRGLSPLCVLGVIGAITNALITSIFAIAPALESILAVAVTIEAIITSVFVIIVASAYAIAVIIYALLYCAGVV